MTLKNYSSAMDVSNGGPSSLSSSASSLMFPALSTSTLSTIDEQSRNNTNSNDKFIPSLHAKLRKFILRSASANISQVDPVIKTIYLGNVVTTWGKGSGCLERPSAALWRNHCEGRASIRMTVSVHPSGLKVETSEHGLTEYWNNRLTWCGIPNDSPKLFCWIYRHEGRKLKQELRCHAVLCNSKDDARNLMECLRTRLSEALYDFRKEKLQKQNARLSSYYQILYNSSPSSLYRQGQQAQPGNGSTPTTSQNNYKKERTCPSKLSIIEESEEEEHFLLPELTSYDKVMHHLLQLELRHDNVKYYRTPAVAPSTASRTIERAVVNSQPNPMLKHRTSSLDSSDGTKSSEASTPASASPPSSVIVEDSVGQQMRDMEEDEKILSSSAGSSRSNSAGSELEIFPTTNMDADTINMINASCLKKSPSASLLHHHLKQLQMNPHKNSNSICYEQIICSV